MGEKSTFTDAKPESVSITKSELAVLRRKPVPPPVADGAVREALLCEAELLRSWINALSYSASFTPNAAEHLGNLADRLTALAASPVDDVERLRRENAELRGAVATYDRAATYWWHHYYEASGIKTSPSLHAATEFIQEIAALRAELAALKSATEAPEQ